MGWLLVMTIPPLARVASPVQLLGNHIAGSPMMRLLAIAAIALIPAGVAFARIVRGTVPLEAAQ
jgi:hypothetical protein